MCMEDVRIARATTTSQKTLLLAADTNTQLIPYNADRFSLYIQFTPTTSVCIYPAPLGSIDPANTTAYPTSGEVLIDLNHHGDLVRQPWNGYSNGDVTLVIITETTLDAQ